MKFSPWPWSIHRDHSQPIKHHRPHRTLRSEPLESRNLLSAVSLWDPLSLSPIAGVSITQSTGEKPQSKVWEHNGQWWSVQPNGSGTWLWRLDSSSWSSVLQLSSKGSRADVKVVGDLAHVLMFEGATSELVTLENRPGAPARYDFWTVQPQVVSVSLGSSVETATIDVDSTGRLWVAYDRSTTIEMRYSDGPYTTFSAPITVASGITTDDISSVIAMPGGRIGVFWSNQNSRRFGFKTHVDGANPQTWSADEVPASQSAKSVGGGFADDHVHLATTSDGTLYAAVKTSYDSASHEAVAVLVRRPSGAWDNAYPIDNTGTRGILVVSEAHNELAVIYTDETGGGDIVLRGSALGTIAFGPKQVVLWGNLNDVTSSKAAAGDQILVLATKGTSAVGSLINLGTSSRGSTNAAPVVNAGADQSITLPSSATLAGSATDDGLPSGTLTVAWTKVSGPGTVAFANPNAASTAVTFSTAGPYVLQLTASDGSLQSSDQVTIQVQSAPSSAAGLVGRWAMDGNGTDQSGQGNHGTLAGSASYTAGRIGSALLLASSGRLVVPDHSSLDIQQAITMTAWIRPSKLDTQYFISKKRKGSTNGYELSLSAGGSVFVRFNEASSGNTYRVDSTTKYPTNGQTWMHAAATYDGATIKLYINGQLQATKAANFQIAANAVALGLGAEQDGYRGMSGALDDVRLYSRALSAQEIAALYAG